MILADLMKQRFNEGLSPNLYFWRDKSGLEVDCILDRGKELIPIEIKSGATLSADFFASLVKWNVLTGNDPAKSYVVYGGAGEQVRSQGTAIGWLLLEGSLSSRKIFL